MSESHIPQLTELTKALQRSPDTVIFKCEGGDVAVTALHDSKKSAVVYSFLPDGVIFPRHNHEGVEHLIVISGVMDIEMNGNTQTLGVGEAVFIPEKMPHLVTARGDTEIYGITIPADDGYAND